MLAWYSEVEYFLFTYGSNCYIAAVVAYLASKDVVLGHGWVSVFILVWVVRRSFRGFWFWYLHVLGVRNWYMFYVFVFLEEGTILRSFFLFCVSVEVFAQHSIQAEKPILHSYFHVQDHKCSQENGNMHCLISTKLREILESSVQQLIHKQFQYLLLLCKTKHTSINLIFVVPGIMLYSCEISPTRCNKCVFYSQWLYSTCFGWQSHPSSGVQCCIWPQVSW